MDKVIILLSPDYKRKAEDSENIHGVTWERNMIIERLNNDPDNIIFAKLSSQNNYRVGDILPNYFSTYDVIDLSSDQDTDGFNKLLRLLSGESIVGRLESVSPSIDKGHSVRKR